ncbi:retinoic acid-induced protein 2 [Astyanax mexicanus]|uniref:Retinoic acid induced 2 n=2 Tax=Astyanax mexicanus TaxID=7994 RepID=W5LUI1_ASTMX|nr:retinoic acid-induced protein 2 [Astyanax mexicanus]KAG9269213.1 retinoic acid-induced protein 2 [Astyanax mexicanus]
MEDPCKDSVPIDMANPQEICNNALNGGEVVSKLESETTPIIPNETWNVSSPTITKRSLSPLLTIQATPVVAPATESPGGVALKVATTVLQPICLGESPVVLPILAGTAAPQVGQTGTTPYLMTSQGPLSLPLVLEQQVLQHLNPQLLQQTATCPALSLQNMLCQNPSLALGPPPALDQKGAGPVLDASLLTLLQNPNFAAILQDLFPGQGNTSPTCHTASPPQADPFSSTFLTPPPFAHAYSSPLAPLVPPATLLVPYPVVVPLPVPLPIPIPIPIPVSTCKDTKVDTEPPKPTFSLSKSTQTSTHDFLSVVTPNKVTAVPQPPFGSPSSPVLKEGEVLDLSFKPPQTQQMQSGSSVEIQQFQQDSALDLSVPGERKTCIQSCSIYGLPPTDSLSHPRDRTSVSGEGVNNGTLALGVLRPVDCTPKLDTKLLSSLASLEFSKQHKWVVDNGSSGSVISSVHDAALGSSGNIEIVSTSQTAKVIVSVKDAMPAIFCGKLKGLSGVSTKNFSIKCDASQGSYAALPRAQGEQQGDPRDTLKKIPKNRAIKLKKVSSQEIHILPIKKQRLAAFLPRK